MTVDDHDEAAVGGLPDLPRRASRVRSPSPTWLAAADKDPTLESQAGRHRSVRLRGLQAGRVASTRRRTRTTGTSPTLPRRVRVPGHPRRPDAPARSRPATSTSSTPTNGDSIKKFRDEADKFPMLEETDYGETGYTLLNVTQDGSPLTDQRVRCAHGQRHRQSGDHRQVDAGVSTARQRSVLARASSATSTTTASR